MRRIKLTGANLRMMANDRITTRLLYPKLAPAPSEHLRIASIAALRLHAAYPTAKQIALFDVTGRPSGLQTTARLPAEEC
jgi:hypothetical protein